MEFEEAYQVVDGVVFARHARHLTKAEVTILRGALENQSYEAIAAHSQYSLNYLKRDVGPKFWKLLTDVLGESVNKTNVVEVLQRRFPPPRVKRLPLQESLYSTLPSATTDEPALSIAHLLPQEKASTTMAELAGKVHKKDWGEAVDSGIFYGRAEELHQLKQWILVERCRLVGIVGAGGVGKTTLSVKLADEIRDHFGYFIWRSLRHSPDIQTILTDLITFVSEDASLEIPTDINAAITLLLNYLRRRRCLIVLDGAEVLLRRGDRSGRFEEQFSGYGELLNRIGLERHASCLIITSREKPKEFTAQEGEGLPVRSLQLKGLDEQASREILKAKGLPVAEPESTALVHCYRGNPFALKVAATAVKNLFNNQIAQLLSAGSIVFDGIQRLLEKQFERLSTSEKKVMYWLAIHREWMTLADLRNDIISPLLQAKLLDSLYALGRRSLIEKSDAGFSLQPTVMEYVTEKFIEEVCEEITTEKIEIFNSHTLIKAQTKAYLREQQIRYILDPILSRLEATFNGRDQVKQHITALVKRHQEQFTHRPGYLGSNSLNLLKKIDPDLSHSNFSNLVLWQACLQDTRLQAADFSQSNLARSSFTETLGNILSVAVSPDGQTIATGDDSGHICLWEAATGMKQAVLRGHESWVRSVAFCPTGQKLASGSHDQTVRLWDLTSLQCAQILVDPEVAGDASHRDWVGAVAFSPDGEWLVSGSHDFLVKRWHLASGTRHKFPPCTHRIRSVTFSLDGQWIVTAGDDHQISLWKAATGELITTFQGHTAWVRSVAFSPDGQLLASGGDDYQIWLWDVQRGEAIASLAGHTNWVRSVAFCPTPHPETGGWILASGSDDCSVKLWDTQTLACLRSLDKHTGMVWSVAFSPTGDFLVSGGNDQTLRLWDWRTGNGLQTVQGYTAGVRAIAFSPKGQYLASGSNDHTVRLWDVEAGRCDRVLVGHTGRVWCVAFSPDGHLLASGGDDKSVRLWHLTTGETQILSGHCNFVQTVAFSPDGHLLASAGHDRDIRFWDVATGTCLRCLKGHQHWVQAIAFSPDGKTLASVGDEMVLRLWDVATGHCRTLNKHHAHRIRGVAFSEDGKTLATSSDDQTIALWDVEQGTYLGALHGHTSGVQSVAFAPFALDGRLLLASGADDKTVRLWDVNRQQEVQVLLGHERWVRTVAFHPEGTLVASGSQDETIRLWDSRTGALRRVLRVDRPYENMNITGIQGLTDLQKLTLRELGAIENDLTLLI
ncbi:MAG TPA: NACHT domain-containing protein [Synechococcales cyanobacterium M55_K2018_004]|nr:NACHT domain-containing protein [Synechococcales cyanobacterium M55_K2018_004]